MIKNLFDAMKNTQNLTIFAITCSVICLVSNYKNFEFIEFGTFKLSFDFIFFFALVGAIVGWLMLIFQFITKIYGYLYSFVILSRLIDCTKEEKEFLYNRLYENGNELSISMKEDSYFFKIRKSSRNGGFAGFEPRRIDLNTKEKIINFLRSLEDKKIIVFGGNQHMRIPQIVWDTLRKNSNKIFKSNG